MATKIEETQTPPAAPVSVSKRTDLLHVTPDHIEVEEGFNARVDYGDIEGLALSIIENGVKVPARAYKKQGSDKLTLIDGHRRFAALQRAHELGHTDILFPVVKESRVPSEAEKTLALITFNDGKRLTPVEEATVYGRLESYGWNASEIAKKVGKSATHVGETMRLLSISEPLKKLITSGKVSSTTVIEQLKKNDAATVERAVKKALSDNGDKKVSTKHLPKSEKPSISAKAKVDGISAETLLNALNVHSKPYDTADPNGDAYIDWDEMAKVIKELLP